METINTTTIATGWNLGNFNPEVSMEMDEDRLVAFATLGLRWACQRQADIDLILGVMREVPGVKAGTTKREATGLKRGDVPFSEVIARKLEACFSALKLPSEEGEEEENYVYAATATVREKQAKKGERKNAMELRKITEKRTVGPEALAAMAEKVGFAGALDGSADAEFAAAIAAFLKASLD
jgi:hypothetical protein